jgi:AcrR family transcriptional regulator
MGNFDVALTGAGTAGPYAGRMTVELETRLMRRAPMQRRSTQRVDRMLDVCARLLDEVGYEALTTKAIAEQAGISIGSVYQYFPDKRSMVRSLAIRYLEEFLHRLEQRLADPPLRTWRQLVEAMLVVYAEMLDGTPGFRAIRVAPAQDPFIMQPGVDNATVITAGARARFSGAIDLPEHPHTDHVLVCALTMGDALVQLAYRGDPAGDPAILAELTRVVTGYLEAELPAGAE